MTMKTYRNPADGKLWAYESDGSQDKLIPVGFVRLTDDESAAAKAAQDAADQAAARVPFSVTPFQAKAAIFAAGLLPAVEAAIAAAPKVSQLAWTDATEFTRDSPTIATMAAAIGLTDAQVDALFIAAKAIEA